MAAGSQLIIHHGHGRRLCQRATTQDTVAPAHRLGALAKVKAMTYSAPTNERIRTALASCVVLAVGYLDGYGLLVLGTYVSFMSGNSTMTGVSAGQGNWAAALTPA